ncbi:MAG: Group 2 hemoglobin GlbO [Acidobacteriota bacterium]|jgi:hemoglobin
MHEAEVFQAVGEEGFARLVRAFYRQVEHDDILGPMYPKDDMEGAEERLRDFLVGRFGGPTRYIEQRGHPRLRARHMPFPVTPAARDRWIQLMTNAMNEAQLHPEAADILNQFFDQMATFMINRPS